MRHHAKESVVTQVGSAEAPLRVAVIGSGPAGFYTAEHLFKRRHLVAEVDMFERLPMPFGLVRFGVAPDHLKIKAAAKAYDRVASRPAFRFFGNVDFGSHVTLEDLRRHYHAICFATGAQTDRSMGIPGEDLRGSHPATEFVAWYNGHPDYRDHQFNLAAERVVVVGVGNVAVDVARILARTSSELLQTDIADYALDALGASCVKEICVLGRRGPAQAAFTNAELKELGELEDAEVHIPPDDVTLDPLSSESLEVADRAVRKKVEILQELARRVPAGRSKRLVLRFLVSPVELIPDASGSVASVRIVRNTLFRADDGTLRPRATDVYEELPAQLVFRSVGYRGVPLAGVPFDDRRGVVPSARGRVLSQETGGPVSGLYVSGWIKRGPTGIIGTNKPDAGETVESLLADVTAGAVLQPQDPDPAAVERLLRERQPDVVSFDDWRLIDAAETASGMAVGRPRVKLTSVREALDVIRQPRSS